MKRILRLASCSDDAPHVVTALASIGKLQCLELFLEGYYKDPLWREQMRELIGKCSQGPFETNSVALNGSSEQIAVITNAKGEIVATFGPAQDAFACRNTLLFIAAANAIRRLLDSPEFSDCG